MRAKIRSILFVLFISVGTLAGYIFWLNFRPVEIVAVHHRSGGFSAVLVKNFPLTDKGKIYWWLENSKNIGEKYQIPLPDKDGSFYLTFWLFGEGYKREGKYDRLCFNDMNTPENCIDKNAVFSVENTRDKEIIFTVYDGRYLMKKDGNILKLKYD